MQPEERYALQELEKLALLNIIAIAIIFAGFLANLAIIGTAPLLEDIFSTLPIVTGFSSLILVIPLAGLVVGIIALIKLYRGWKGMKNIDKRLSTIYRSYINNYRRYNVPYYRFC